LTIKGSGACNTYSSASACPWYNYSSEIYSFIVEDGVTSIPPRSVEAYSNLKSAVIADTVTSSVVFQKCANLESVKLSKGMTSIASFDGCLKLKSVEIPEGVTTIGERVFYNCRSMKSVVIPSSVYQIWDYAFYNCTSLESLVLPYNISSIGESAFRHCKSLKTVVLPEKCTALNYNAFADNLLLERVIIPKSVEFVAERAFTGCKSLISVIYQGTKRLAITNSFQFCDKLDIVCVPLDYDGDEFCNRTVYKSDSCEKVVTQTNKCYGVTINEGVISTWERQEAKDWENQTNACVKYQCDNETGFVSWGMCNSSVGDAKVCIDNTCKSEAPMLVGSPVIISLARPVDASAVDPTETLDLIRSLIQTRAAGELSLGLETDAQGRVDKIIVFVDGDKGKAEAIARAVNNLDKGEDCQYGILCESTSAFVYDPQSSQPSSTHSSSTKSSSQQTSSVKSGSSQQTSSVKSFSSHQTSSVKSGSSHPQSLPQPETGAAVSEHNSNICAIVTATALVIAFVSLF